jgi:hypothetical protein
MGFLKLIDKKNIPDELPSLITEDIRKNSEEKTQEASREINKSKIENNKNQDIAPIIEQKLETNSPVKEEIKKESIPEEKINEEKDYPEVLQDSFFIRLQEDLGKEMNSLNKLEQWYNTKLLPEDTLSEMKNYWEKQKSNSMIQILGKDFQDKITKKIIILQKLEKSWQDTYFSLIEKEEAIKEQERELKKMLAEFIGFCKKRVKNERTKEKKEPKKRKSH